jgi:rhodanese-related sulfurtransferase
MILVGISVWFNPQGHFALKHWRLREVGVAELVQFKTPLLVDVRTVEQYREGHMPEAISLPSAAWDESLLGFLDQWSPERIVIIYDDGGPRAEGKQAALKLLTDLPDMHVYLLHGGFPLWADWGKKNTN